MVDTSCNVAWGGQQCELHASQSKAQAVPFTLLQVKLPVQKGQKSAQAIGEVLCQTAADLDAAVMIIASHGT